MQYHQYVQGNQLQTHSEHEPEDVIITSSVSQAGESPPQVCSEAEDGSVITNDNALQEKVSLYQSDSQ